MERKKPWQPRIDEDRELNPSVRTAMPEAELEDRSLEDIEADTEESEAREGDPEPIKTR
ncbi:MAG TPA: hypothetical protein VGH84_00335 [Steroidobacteraceae bacterium]|jgi:hypothetical protein